VDLIVVGKFSKGNPVEPVILMLSGDDCEGNTDDEATTKRQARRLELIKE
jgi:hypothetical protein